MRMSRLPAAHFLRRATRQVSDPTDINKTPTTNTAVESRRVTTSENPA